MELNRREYSKIEWNIIELMERNETGRKTTERKRIE